MKLKIEPNTVAILLTDKCTAECEMCCFSCSPRNNNVIDKKIVKRTIEQASQMNSIFTIGFSGGEVFIYYEFLMEMIDYATKLGLQTTCTTNGFWATTYETTLDKLIELKKKGLSKIGLSVDHYHQRFVDIDNIKNILKACKRIGMPVDIGSVITKSTSDLSELLFEIKDYMINVPHFRAACLPFGNASNLVKEDLYYDENLFSRDEIKCYELNFFSIYTNGDVYPCCSQAGVIPCLRLGNIKTDTLEGMLSKYRGNMYIRIIKKHGLSWFVNIAQKENLQDIMNCKYVSKCELCNRLLNNKIFLDVVQKYIQNEKELIYKKYMSEKRFNETQ